MLKKRQARIKRWLVRSYLVATVSITLVLFLVGMMALLVLNAGRLSDYVRENVGFTLILNDDVREVEVLRLQKNLSATKFVKTTRYVDKEEAAKELAKDLGEDFAGFLGFNPLFSSVDVKLHAAWMQADSLTILERKFLEYPQVKEVYYQRDLVKVINDNVQRLSILLLVFSGLLLFIFITLINNTIRISIYSQRFIINTMKLVGATRSFIRRPFVIKSVSYGLVAGLVADACIFLLIWSYRKDFGNLISWEQSDSIAVAFAVVLLFGMLISWLSTHLAVNKFLRLRFEELFY
ncbi:MAG: permease-like cell division protein FtsX [Prolixibacteraceae bacterium]